MTIKWPKWTRIINEAFVFLTKCTDRYIICIGGRGSSKSDWAAKYLIFRCLTAPFFRCILVRKQYNTIKDSQYQNLKDIITGMGLAPLFTFRENPLEIRCINGNKFIARGCDDPTKLKSTKDPTCVWYEEDIPEENHWLTITTSIRTKKADYLQEIFTVNPEVEGDYQENWFYKRFFKKYEGKIKTFRDTTELKAKVYDKASGLYVEKVVNLAYTVHHSTYNDNRWLPIEFRAFLETFRLTNEYYYTIYTLGEWGNRITGGLAYKAFTRSKQVSDRYDYDPKLPLHLTFDFNVHPYVTITIHQVHGNEDAPKRIAVQVDEILATDPDNSTTGACKLFKEKYPHHNAGLFIYGDPSGRKEDTRGEKGHNDFHIIKKDLSDYQPAARYANSAPPVVQRINWLNSVFTLPEVIEILIHPRCTRTVIDYTQGKQASDGTKLKEKVKDEKTGIQYEKYHHITDANDYFYTIIFKAQFNQYLRGLRKYEYDTGPKPGFAHSEW